LLLVMRRQHAGFVLGALSIFLTWYTWDEHNPNSVWRALACLCLCLVGLGFHEMRPFKVSGARDGQERQQLGGRQLWPHASP
jgi:hypothetical protein